MMDMMDSKSHDMCKGLDEAIAKLQEYQANPDMVTEKTLGNVIKLLSDHRNQVMGDTEGPSEDVPGDETEPSDMSRHPILNTPYRSDNMKRQNPYAR